MSGPGVPPGHQDRSVARLATVQALYQMEVAGAGVETVVREFADHRFGGDLDGARLADADEPLFGELLRGVVEDQASVQPLQSPAACETAGDGAARAILRAGTWELIHRPGTPVEVVIDEYVELAKAFFDDRAEASFINAALDGVARDVRPD